MRLPLLALLATLTVKAVRVPLQGAPPEVSIARADQFAGQVIPDESQGDPASALVASLPGPREPLDPAVLETAWLATPPEAVAQRTIRTVEVVVGATRESIVRIAHSGRKLGAPLVSFAQNFGPEQPGDRVPGEVDSEKVTVNGNVSFAGAPQEPVEPPLRTQIVTLANSASNRAGISILVDGKTVTLQPGQTFSGPPAATLTVEFHRGGDFGNASHALKPGAFVFEVRKNGWNLVASDPLTDHGAMGIQETGVQE